jgi:Putative DNA-binding domain
MPKIWNEASVNQYIIDAIEESLTIEYKAAASLGKTDSLKKEMTKDVSAMSNSSGGIILYGISEFNQPEKKHLPEKIDPVDRLSYSREWLEQVINNIRPRIEGLVIHSVQLSSDQTHVVHVVEIPQSVTAHQATDHRYYKRYNFLSISMEDYEIRDVMNRQKHPSFSVSISIERQSGTYSATKLLGKTTKEAYKNIKMLIEIQNVGTVIARHVAMRLNMAISILEEEKRKELNYSTGQQNAHENTKLILKNTERDVVDGFYSFGGGYVPKYGPSWFDPILPGLSHVWKINLDSSLQDSDIHDHQIDWEIYADEAPSQQGNFSLKDVKLVNLPPKY